MQLHLELRFKTSLKQTPSDLFKFFNIMNNKENRNETCIIKMDYRKSENMI